VGLTSPSLPPDAPEEYRRFWELWQAGEFFACHEVLEDLWRATSGPQRLFYNGLIHCAVALYQHERGNAVGAARQLLRAQVKLARFLPAHDGVDVAALLAGVEAAIGPSLARLNNAQRAQLPALRRSLEQRVQREFL
jgi:uncharacterized protein